MMRRTPTCHMAALLLLLSASAFAQDHQNENALLYHGNAFYWKDASIDTVMVADPETGEIATKIIRVEGAIAKMNEEAVYNGSQLQTRPPVFKYAGREGRDAAAYFRDMIKLRYEGMPSFTIQKMVINQYGKPVYFEIIFDDVDRSREYRLKWGGAIEKLITNMPRWEPGTYKGQPVLYYINPEIHLP